jgi:hypothetical protein
MSKKKSKTRLKPGAPVVVVLHNPPQNYWGVLDEISSAGVFLRGLDLNAFDDWLHALVHDEPFIGIGNLFFPMWRVERISKDEAGAGIPSLFEQALQRAGDKVTELFEIESSVPDESKMV